MPFSTVIDRYFRDWAQSPTWETMQGADEAKFYRSVHAAKRYSRSGVTGDRVMQELIAMHAHAWDPDALRQQATAFSGRFDSCLRCLRVVGFPTPLVERTSPRSCHIYMKSLQYPPLMIEDFMRENFGERWRDEVRE